MDIEIKVSWNNMDGEHNSIPQRPSPAKRQFKKRKSMLDGPPFQGLPLEEVLSAIKQESQALSTLGAGHFFNEGVLNLEMLSKYYHPHLNGSEAKYYKDSDGKEYLDKAEENVISVIGRVIGHSYDDNIGTIPLKISAYNAFSAYLNISGRLKRTEIMAKDGLPVVKIDQIELKMPARKGGFSGGYKLVNVAEQAFVQAEQDRVLFGYNRPDFLKQAGPELIRVYEGAVKAVEKAIDKKVVLLQAHILFHWNAHSFFTYHADAVGTWTMVVMLTEGASTFHMAGFPESATYNKPGDCHLFRSKMSHRSGTAPRRAVKVSFFFDEAPPMPTVNLIEDNEEEPENPVDGSVKKDEDFVKPEPPDNSTAVAEPSVEPDASNAAPDGTNLP